MATKLTDAPADVIANGCPFCGAGPLFIHGTSFLRTGRDCDACGTMWSAEDMGWRIGVLLGASWRY